MASLYTDEAREERYFRLRAKKKRLDGLLDITMWITLACAAIVIIPGAMSAFLNGVFLGDMRTLLEFLMSVAVCGFTVYAIYCKNFRHVIIAMIGVALLTMLAGAMSLIVMIPLIIAAVVSWEWGKLEKEEGFPHFDITYAEREERERTAESRARNRAIQAGARISSVGQSSDMGDLLDAGHDTMVLAPTLRGQHDRYLGSTQQNTAPQPVNQGIMDSLESIGADAVTETKPHVPQQDPNVPEIQAAPDSLPTLDLMDAGRTFPSAPVQPAAAEAEAALDAISAAPEYDSSADDEILGAIAALNGSPKPQ